MKKTVTVKYDARHSYEYDYTKQAGMFCPNCGQQEVWSEDGEGDFYVGSPFICTNCDFLFMMPTTGRSDDIAKQLKEVQS